MGEPRDPADQPEPDGYALVVPFTPTGGDWCDVTFRRYADG